MVGSGIYEKTSLKRLSTSYPSFALSTNIESGINNWASHCRLAPKNAWQGYPCDLAYAGLFMISDKASFISGQCLAVDGGGDVKLEDLVLWIEEPSIALTEELMREVDLVVATGGTSMVKDAYSSGTPVYGVRVGNSVCIVDETADLDAASKKIFLSKMFDFATSCSTENSPVIQNSVFDSLVE